MSVDSGYESIMSPESESTLKENIDSNFDCGAVKPLNNPYENSGAYMEFDLGNLNSDEDLSNSYEKDFNELFDLPAVKMLLNSKQEAGEVRKQHMLNTCRHIETDHISGDLYTFIFEHVKDCVVHLTEELLHHSFDENSYILHMDGRSLEFFCQGTIPNSCTMEDILFLYVKFKLPNSM